MAPTTRPIFGHGRLRVSQITFHCDLHSRTGHIIPLGVMTELKFGSIYGLGLLAPEQLSNQQLDKVGALLRPRLTRPFDFLNEDFDRVWNADCSESEFNVLSDVHYSSLRFSEPTAQDVKLPLHVASNSDDLQTQLDWAKEHLRAESFRLFFELLREHWPKMPVSPPSDRADAQNLAA